MIRVGIIGGAGYTGGELIRLLLNHSGVTIQWVNSHSQSGKHLGEVHGDLFYTDISFSQDIDWEIDALFLCAGHGESRRFLSSHEVPKQIKIIDLGNDFRLEIDRKLDQRTFVYGLPEIFKDNIVEAHSIANPGCFATAI